CNRRMISDLPFLDPGQPVASPVDPDGHFIAIPVDVKPIVSTAHLQPATVGLALVNHKMKAVVAKVQCSLRAGFFNTDKHFPFARPPLNFAPCHEIRHGPEVQISENSALFPSPPRDCSCRVGASEAAR